MHFPDDVPTLTDGTVTLRAPTLSDVDAGVEQCVDPESIAWTLVPVPFGREDAVQYFTKVVPDGWSDGTSLWFAVEAEHPDGVRRFSGSVSLRPMSGSVAEIAFGLHPAVRGRGVCSRAVKLLVDWGFQERGFEVVVWYANVGNWASRRVVWANGFSFDGTVEKFLDHRGVRTDAWIASLRADDSRKPKHPWNVSPVLETERLRLREFVDSDAGRLDEMLHDERDRYFNGPDFDENQPKSGAEVLLRIRNAMARGDRYEWCIADRDTDLLLGTIQLFGVRDWPLGEVEAGYHVHEDSRGRGVLRAALRAVADWALRPADSDQPGGGLGLRRVTVITAASNSASRYGAEQAGFTLVSTEPRAFPVGAGELDDKVVYERVG